MATDLLARFAVDTQFDDLPTSVVEAAKLCFLDWLGSTYAGYSAEPCQILRNLI